MSRYLAKFVGSHRKVIAHYHPKGCRACSAGRGILPRTPCRNGRNNLKRIIMAKTSIHIRPAQLSADRHNQRLKNLNYVRAELTPKNEHWQASDYTSVSDELTKIRDAYQKSVGQKMQKKATPIREGVVVISDKTTMADLHKFVEQCEQKWGIKPLTIDTHLDEGHTDKEGKWIPNRHAHIVWRWTDDNGKARRLGKHDMAEMQTLLAECLGMERGKSSDIKHLEAMQYKAEQAQAEQAKAEQARKAEERKARKAEERKAQALEEVASAKADADNARHDAKQAEQAREAALQRLNETAGERQQADDQLAKAREEAREIDTKVQARQLELTQLMEQVGDAEEVRDALREAPERSQQTYDEIVAQHTSGGLWGIGSGTDWQAVATAMRDKLTAQEVASKQRESEMQTTIDRLHDQLGRVGQMVDEVANYIDREWGHLWRRYLNQWQRWYKGNIITMADKVAVWFGGIVRDDHLNESYTADRRVGDLHVNDTPVPLLEQRVSYPTDKWAAKYNLSEGERIALAHHQPIKLHNREIWIQCNASGQPQGYKDDPSHIQDETYDLAQEQADECIIALHRAGITDYDAYMSIKSKERTEQVEERMRKRQQQQEEQEQTYKRGRRM